MNKPPEPSRLIPLKPRRYVVWKSLGGIGLALLGLFLLTGFSPSVWLFLLYPPLILILLFSLATLALHLLRRYSGQ